MVKVCRGTSRRALALASQLFARCARDGDASFGADDCAAAPPYPRGSRVLPLLVGRLHPLSTLQRASVHSPRWLRGALLHQSADHARRRRHAQMGREDGSRRRGSSCRGDQHWSPAGVPADSGQDSLHPQRREWQHARGRHQLYESFRVENKHYGQPGLSVEDPVHLVKPSRDKK